MQDMSFSNALRQSVLHFVVRPHFILIPFLVAACGKSERIPTTAERLAAVQQKQETQPDFYVPRKTVDYMADMKNLRDAPPKVETPPPAAAKSPVTSVAAAPVPAPAPPPVETKPAPAAQAPASTPAKSAPATTQAASTTAPGANVVASAAPTARPSAPVQDVSAAVTVLSRVQPDFPRDAIKSGVESGNVRAKITINAAGDVTDVSILEAQPARVFDRNVKSALSRWKFNAGANNRTYETLIAFSAN